MEVIYNMIVSNNKKNYFLIFLIITLVICIGPVSAALTDEKGTKESQISGNIQSLMDTNMELQKHNPLFLLFLQIFKPSKNDLKMDINTFDGIPIIKHPPMSDWKEYTFVLVKKPDHGTVLPGPGLQFLYGPDEGYIGQDTFTYQYSKNGQIIGTIQVNIDIQAIPHLDVPTKGGKQQ
jgi:hypothetical protein